MPYKDPLQRKAYDIARAHDPKRMAAANAYQKRRRRECPEFRRVEKDIQHRYLYTLEREDYDAMLEYQDFKCAVCKAPFIGPPRVDHDHACCDGARSCGKCVRGLLCADCNLALGIFHDDISRLENAIVYLKELGYGGRKEAQRQSLSCVTPS